MSFVGYSVATKSKSWEFLSGIPHDGFDALQDQLCAGLAFGVAGKMRRTQHMAHGLAKLRARGTRVTGHLQSSQAAHYTLDPLFGPRFVDRIRPNAGGVNNSCPT